MPQLVQTGSNLVVAEFDTSVNILRVVTVLWPIHWRVMLEPRRYVGPPLLTTSYHSMPCGPVDMIIRQRTRFTIHEYIWAPVAFSLVRSRPIGPLGPFSREL